MKYEIIATSRFKNELKLIVRRNKDLKKIREVVNRLANNEKLEERYKDHQLINNQRFKDCRECHIEPDWLLVYRINNENLILLLVETGSHSDLF